jgi:hypothetical protein
MQQNQDFLRQSNEVTEVTGFGLAVTNVTFAGDRKHLQP